MTIHVLHLCNSRDLDEGVRVGLSALGKFRASRTSCRENHLLWQSLSDSILLLQMQSVWPPLNKRAIGLSS